MVVIALEEAALNKLMAGRTTLIIAHRLSTIRAADKIVAFDAGMVVESGAGSDHVLAVARWFRAVGLCNWLVNSLFQMV